MELPRDEGKRRRPALDDDRHQLVRRLGAPLAVEAQEVRRLLDRPEDRPGEHGRAHGVKAKLELGDDPEVAAAAAQAPEEVGVLGLARRDELAVGGDQVDGEQLVDRQPVLSMKPADAAAERQAGDAGVGDDPARGREPERLGLAVELAPEHAGLDPRRARLRVDADPLHRPQVDDDAAVADRQARIAVAPASDGDREAGAPGEPDRRHHVGHAGAARDQRREAIDRPVPDPAVLVVGRAAGADELALERRAQLVQRGLVDPDAGSDAFTATPPPTRRPTPGTGPSTAGA